MNRLGQDWDEDPADDSAGSGVLGQTLRYAAILLGVGLLISWGLSRVPELPKLSPQAGANSRPAQRPPAPLPAARQRGYDRGGYEMSVLAGANGHFMLAAMANGSQMDSMVDTGASSAILNPEDAQRRGVNVHVLDFSEAIRTANGKIRDAPVTLRELRVGQFHMDQVPVIVISAPLGVSLLSESFLSGFESFEMQ